MSKDKDDIQTRTRIIALANAVLGNERLAEQWLSTPKERFAGQTPLEMLRSSQGAQRVEELLLEAFFGNVG